MENQSRSNVQTELLEVANLCQTLDPIGLKFSSKECISVGAPTSRAIGWLRDQRWHSYGLGPSCVLNRFRASNLASHLKGKSAPSQVLSHLVRIREVLCGVKRKNFSFEMIAQKVGQRKPEGMRS